jgi:hypothetical protein
MSGLDEILTKFERAHEHLNILNKEIERFIKGKPCGHTSKREPKGECEYDVIVRVQIKTPPPIRLSVIIGEILYHIRSALDHLVYQLTLANGVTDEKILDSCEFPIFDKPTKFTLTRKSGERDPKSGLYKMRGVDAMAQAIIEGLQPYHSGANITTHPLWVLHQLCNIDKHRRLCLIQNPIGSVELVNNSTFIVTDMKESICHPLKDDTEILRFRIRTLSNFQGEVKVRQKVPPQIAFEETIPLPDVYAGEVLQEILIFVENNVFPKLAHFLY